MKWPFLSVLLVFWGQSAFPQSDFTKFYNAGQTAESKGQYQKAIIQYCKAEKKAVKAFEKNRVYQALANNYKAISDYNHAISYYNKLLSIYKGANQQRVLLNLSDLWLLTGQYRKVVDNLKDMQQSPDESVRLTNLSAAYLRLGRQTEALSLLNQVLASADTTKQRIALQNKGYTLWSMGRLTEADSALQTALQLFGNTDPKRYVCLANLAKVQAGNGLFDKAISSIDQALEWQLKNLGNKHFDYIISLRKKAEILQSAKKTGDAAIFFKLYFQHESRYIIENFAYMTENERLNFWHSQKPLIDECYCIEAQDPDFLFDVAVFSKSVLTQANRNFATLAAADSNIAKLYDSILEIRNSARNASVSERTAFDNRSEALETQLADKLPSLRKFYADLKIDGKEIRKALKNNNDAVVEFIYYPRNDTMQYAALVIRKTKPVRFVPLFAGNDIEKHRANGRATVMECIKSNRQNFKNMLFSDTLLAEMIWGKIVDGIPQNANVYFTPDGIFHNLGIEYMCFQRPDLRIYRLSSAQTLCRAKSKKPGAILLVGGLDYNDASESLQHPDTLPVRLGSQMLARNDHKLNWRYLPNSLSEIDSVEAIIDGSGLHRQRAERTAGTEDFMKRNLPLTETALISTHGYTFGSLDVKNDYSMTDNITADSTMSLCGIILSGANSASQQNSANTVIEDGYLTALELSELNLSNLNLVILSACQTGLGQVSIDGVAGIPRGLKKAGANAILVSLWEVDDLATRLLMTGFFEGLKLGLPKQEALRRAQERLRGYNETVRRRVSSFSPSRMSSTTIEEVIKIDYFDNPYYWAPFILIDGIN